MICQNLALIGGLVLIGYAKGIGYFVTHQTSEQINMATLSNDQLAAMSFGYLTGSDLMAWCPAQLLIKQYEINQSSLQNGVMLAEGEVIRALLSRYAIQNEFTQVSGGRDVLVVKITSIMAIRNILGNMAGVSELLIRNFEWADKTLMDLRNGFINLIMQSAAPASYSDSSLVPQNFQTLG